MIRPTINNIVNSDPFELLEWAKESFTHEVPSGVNSVSDMNRIGMLLGVLTNEYSYLVSLTTELGLYSKMAKMSVPIKPKGGDTEEMANYIKKKEEAEIMEQRKKVISCFADILKQQYNAVSRMLTVYTQSQEELKMTDCKR